MKLYGYWRSSATWRLRIALNWKGLAYETVPVHLVRREQHSDEHLARNPMAQVPVLELEDGTVLSQSLPIIEYLEGQRPEPALLPDAAIARAQVRAMAEVVNAGIQPIQNFRVLMDLVELGVDKKAWGAMVIDRGLRALEVMAKPLAGRFLYGDALSMADLCLIPQLYNARRFGVDLTELETLCRVEQHCQALPAFIEAHPDAQIDAQR